MMEWTIRLPGPVVPWARVRVNTKTGTFFTHPKVKAYQNTFKMVCRAAGVKCLEKGPVSIIIISRHKIPKRPASGQEAGMPYTARPDVDNIEKVFMDALNGVAFHDDAQVTSLSSTKIFAVDDGITVKIFHRHLTF